ncbi:actinin alpha 2 [Podila clonocystis]|nr:actinin alpha 2 [Podila clonocystis]
MSWLLKSKRLQSAGNNTTGIYSLGSNSNTSGSFSNNNNHNTGNGSSSNLLNNAPSHSFFIQQSLSSNNLIHFDAGEDMVRQFAASQLDTQKTAFMRWVNVQLANTPYTPMTAIEKDLRDGKRLIGLLEAVSKEPLKPERGNMRIHQMANVSKALAFLEKRTDDTLGTIGNEDIVDGNIKLTLGLVWIIIYRFQIQQIANDMAELYPILAEDMLDGEDSTTTTTATTTAKGKKKASSQQVDAKQALLRWVRYQLEDYSDVIPPIQDFHRSWRTGLAFTALIHRHDPEFLPEFYTSVLPLPFETSDEWKKTLTNAFDLALEKMALPRLLVPEDLIDVETPDERSIMTYISEYYLVMSKHQSEQDPAVAADLRAKRLQAKHERLALAGEDQEATRRRLQEDAERKRREEQEELERIRLRRMEIEGWSIRAAERAKEEEEALRKRRQEEEEKRLQRKLRREQREREKELLRQQSGGLSSKSAIGSPRPGSVFSESDHEYSDSDTEALDPKEQEQRQQELNEKLAEYHQGIAELSEWVRQQDGEIPHVPDTSSPLDRARDLEPLTDAIKMVEEAQTIKEHIMSHLHDVREELLEYENPDLAPEKVNDMDKKWWELETIWTELSNKVVGAKDAAEEVKWIIDCTQEIDRVNGEIKKFEAQLLAAAEKRNQETIQDRSQKSALEQQDVNLSSISFLLKTYLDFLTSLMDPKVHHYDAPEHLTARNTELTTVILPHLQVIIEKAQQNLASDRLLRSFLDAFVLSEAWIGESIEWLANIEVPKFVSEDIWMGANTVQQYMSRDDSQDLDLDFYQAEVDELKMELEDEQREVTTFRSSGFAKLDEQATTVMQSVKDNEDPTVDKTTKAVQDMMSDVMSNLVKVEDLLPKEAVNCDYTTKVLDYLLAAQSVLTEIEAAFEIIHYWEMSQPDAQVEASVTQVETGHSALETAFQDDTTDPYVWGSVQLRHGGLTTIVKDLRVCFHDKKEMIKGDRQMKAFLDFTLACQTILREFRTNLHNEPPWTGFGDEDLTPFDKFDALVKSVGLSFDSFESGEYAKYLESGEAATIMANHSNARQDPAVIQSKLEAVAQLLNDIKALKSDRERDSQTVVECRELTKSFQELRTEFSALEAEFSALQTLEPDQVRLLKELSEKSNQLGNRRVTLEQDSSYRYLAKDPSCSAILGGIKNSQSSIEQDIVRLQSNLESKQQWDLAWEKFSDRAVILEQYLQDAEKEVTDRGYHGADVLCADETWWRSDCEFREALAANSETLSSLKAFERLRLTELSALSKALQECAELVGGAESLDPVRKAQFEESKQRQQDLVDHLSRLHGMNDKEKYQLDLLAKRLNWSQVTVDSKSEVDMLINSCQGAIQEYSQLIQTCQESGDSSNFNLRAAEQMKEQVEHLISLAATKKAARKGAAHDAFMALAQQASNGGLFVPTNLDKEMFDFKDQYTLLDSHLAYASQLVQHAEQIASYLQKADSVDSDLINAATDLKSDREASVESIDNTNQARAAFSALAKELDSVLLGPTPSEKIEEHYKDSTKDQQNLEAMLKTRLQSSLDLDQALHPLMDEFRRLLEYQDGLRSLVNDLDGYGRWAEDVRLKVAAMDKSFSELFSTWPDQGADYNQGAITRQASTGTRDVLSSELEYEILNVQAKKQEFVAVKEKVNQTLKAATSHSRQLQATLEGTMVSIDEKVQHLESELKAKSHQLHCFDCTVAWEKEINAAQHALRETADALDELIHHDARWSQADRGAKKASEAQNVVDWLKAAIKDYESQLKSVEEETKPAVDRTWAEVCSSLVFASRSVPDEFQNRQDIFEQQIGALRSQIAYSHDVVSQREALDAIAAKLEELDEVQQQLKSLADSPALVTDVPQDGSGLSLSGLSEKIRKMAQELAADFKSVRFPVDESCAAAKTRAQESNAAIRNYIHQSQSHVEQAVKAVKDTELKRELSLKQQELETILEQQGKAISDKHSSLERVSALLTWADETGEVVAELLHQDQDSEDSKESDISGQTVSGSSSPDQVMSASTSVTNGLSTVSSLATISMSTSASSVSTLTPTSPTTSYSLSKHFPSVATLARLPVEKLESMISHVEDIRLEVEEMKEYKASVQEEISEKSALSVEMDEYIDHLAISSAQYTKTNIAGLVPADAFQDMNMSIEQNSLSLSNLDNEISEKLDLFDAKTDHLLEQLGQQAQLLSTALKERQQADIEKALREAAERFRQQKEREMQAYEESKNRFLAWTEGHKESLSVLWESHGLFSRDGATQDGITVLESETVRCKDILKDQESMYLDLKSKMEIAFKDTGRTAELAEHTEKIDGAWSMIQNESNGYHALLKQMNAWSDLNNRIAKFEKEGLEALEKRVEALRWMPWEAFQQEEKDLLGFIDSVEAQASVLREQASHINSTEPSLDLLEHHRQVLEANSMFFEQRMAEIPGRVQVARSQMEIIHETTKEIALHAKFHADLVRIETAIEQQIDTVKARLGSLERSSCFALNSKALETVVTAANEVSVEARYQFSVLQEVEYSALEQTAFDLDMIEGQVMNEDGELQGYEGSRASRKTSVQESMERIRASLKRLEGYIEEDCFETLLAAEFYTHTKATEDVRQWIGACRESMTQLSAPDFGCQGMEGASTQEVRKQAIEARTRHIAGLEKKLHQFGPTIQNYDVLSSDFFQLHHPASSTLNLNLPESSSDHQDSPQDSMRTILRQTVQERNKRTREDWELLKQEFMAKVAALEELKAQQEKDEAKGNSDTTNTDGLEAVRRGSMSKSKTIGRFGSDILEDIARVTHEIEVMVEHGSPSLIENLDSLAHDVEQNLEVISNMVDRLNDWRLIEKHGAAVEHWQKVKLQALAKRQELDESGHWNRRSNTEVAFEGRGSGLGIHTLEGNTSRTSVVQPTASPKNRVKAILGSPAETTPAPRRKKRFSTGNIMNRNTFSPPSPATTRTGATKATGTGRVRSGTAPGLESNMSGPLETLKKSTIGSPSLQAMSPTFSAEAKRRPPIIRKNDSNTSISSVTSIQALESNHMLSPSMRPQRTVYKADPTSSLDVEVARVVNASGFIMKVQKLKDGQQPPLKGSNTSTTRLRSSSTVNLAVESDGNVEYVSGLDSASSSPRQVQTIRGQGRMSGGSSPGRSGDDTSSGEVGRYVFGDVEPKVCFCRILRSRKVMVRVGGGWSELSKFMEDHASLEQRKAKGRLSATNSAVSIASTTTTTNLGGVLSDARSVGQGGSSDSLPESVTSSNGEGTESRPRSNAGTPRVHKRREFIYHVRPSDDLSLKTIKFVKNGAGEALVSL